MQAIDWKLFISEAKYYIKFRDETDSLTKKKEDLATKLPRMESIFELCTEKKFQHIFDLYMSSPATITEESYLRLAKDIEEAKADFKACKRALKNASGQMAHKYKSIHYILTSIMDERHKDCCSQFYCPDELVKEENIPALKIIISFARQAAPTMYGEGGFAYGDSVIGNLSKKVDKLEANLNA